MAYANDITKLLERIERRLGLTILLKKLPADLNKEAWAKIIKDDSLVVFSRYYPRKVRFVVNEETCHKITEDKKTKWIIKDEYLEGCTLLGVTDIDWQDTSMDNLSIGQTAGYGYYTPNFGTMESTLNAFVAYQNAADTASLYNNNIYVDFEYPNKISISRAGNLTVNLNSFVVNLIVEHTDLTQISPTMMETFEQLAQSDIARFLYMNLRYYDGLETVFMNIDLKLNELEQEASKRENVIEKLADSYVSFSNSAQPMIMTVSG